MHSSAIHDPYANATPSQRSAARLHLERLRRIRCGGQELSPKDVISARVQNHATIPAIPNEMFSQAWNELNGYRPPPYGLIEMIQRSVVAEFPGITLIDLKSARRTANVVRPRQIAMYLAKTMTTRSLPDIGRRFGGRDHTTVLHAVRKISQLIEHDQRVSEAIDKIKTAVSDWMEKSMAETQS